MTTNWVLAGGYQGFPLLFGWRVLPGSAAADAGMSFLGGIEETVAHWDGSAAVRQRVEAIRQSSASIVLFLEHTPIDAATLAAKFAAAPVPADYEDSGRDFAPGLAGKYTTSNAGQEPAAKDYVYEVPRLRAVGD